MAYQPLFATLRDSCGQVQSHSLRSRVDWITFWLNSHFGSVMSVSAKSDGSQVNTSRVYECELKIEEWTEKGNQKRVDYWKAELESEQAKKEDDRVDVHITLNSDPRFHFNLNGIRFTAKDLEILEKTEMRDFLGVLSIGAAFALIPDMKRMIEAETDEERSAAVQTFIEKRDKLTEFIGEEDAKIEAAIDGVGY